MLKYRENIKPVYIMLIIKKKLYVLQYNVLQCNMRFEIAIRQDCDFMGSHSMKPGS